MKTGPLPPLTALRAFEAVARHMSFKRAAAELNVTPAAVSHQIKSLEDHLGQPLIIRLNRSIQITESGRQLADGLSTGFEQLRHAVETVRPQTRDKILVVGTGPGFTAKWLAPRLWRFLDANPDMEVRISASLGMSDFVTDGVDMAVRFGRIRYEGLFGEAIVTDAVAPMASPSIIEDLSLRNPKDLARAPLLHDDSLSFLEKPPNWAAWCRYAGVDEIDVQRGVRMNQTDHALDAAVAGAGVVLGRVILSEADRQAGRLVIPFGPVMSVGLSYHIVCPHGRENEPKIKRFRDWLRQEAKASEDAIPASP